MSNGTPTKQASRPLADGSDRQPHHGGGAAEARHLVAAERLVVGFCGLICAKRSVRLRAKASCYLPTPEPTPA